MTTPNPVGPGGFFSLFDLPPTIYKVEALERLGTIMAQARAGAATTAIPSGYVYFGQLVAHDITKLQKPAPDQVPPGADHLVQLRTPSLDLDCVYGTGFEDETVAIDERTGEMKLGLVTGIEKPTPDDLPRRRGSPIAHIPDERNDENLLLAQLHVLFLKLHNFFVREIRAKHAKLEPRQLFEEARLQVILHYQQVVLYDFLVEVCHPRVWEYVIGNNRERLWDAISAEEARMPVELFAAGLRFGHSMVRDSYQINDEGKVVELADLFAMTGKGGLGGNLGLPATHVVDWRLFLHGDDATAEAPNVGLAIDPIVHIRLPHPESDFLASKNLKTGNLSRLPDGQTLVRHIKHKHPEMALVLGLDVLKPELLDTQVSFNDGGGGMFRRGGLLTKVGLNQGFTHKTPLWYYLLAEANATSDGQHLGVLGSLLVADLIRALVCLSSPSVLTNNFKSLYIVPANGRAYLTLKDLAKAVGITAGVSSAARKVA